MQGSGIEQALAYQDEILPGVSRTFALTIPALPPALRTAVTNAYLLCRLADTIEDEPCLGPSEVREFQHRFVGLIKQGGDVKQMASDLSSRLSDATSPDEKELVKCMSQVLTVTDTFSPAKKDALIRCIEVMCEQMPRFQNDRKSEGLVNVAELDQYCYAVAGIVGEMLTDLFCSYSDEISAKRDNLMRLAPSFGQGLQMVNILKDVWEDRADGSCWLPRDVFLAHGYDLRMLDPRRGRHAFNQGLDRLVAIGHGHLRNALKYALMIPDHETGIRRFLLWSINMAILTLRNIHRSGEFSSADEVKISRSRMYSSIAATTMLIRSDAGLKSLFWLFSRGLPLDRVDQTSFNEPRQTV